MGNLPGSSIQMDKKSNYGSLKKIFKEKKPIKMDSKGLSPQKISFSKKLADKTYLIGFKRNFEFQAGQIVGIALEPNGPRRLYSICSGTDDNEVSILYNEVDEGYLTPQLSDLNVGDSIWITKARGKFLSDSSSEMWIATGTGIAPYYSMMKSGIFSNKTLLHGERTLEKFYFKDEFTKTLGENYVRCCSAESDDSTYNGRVTDYLKQTDKLKAEMKYYLCGRTEMVVEARDILIERGIPFENIISEIYF